MNKKQFTIKRRLTETKAYRDFALGLFSFLVAFLVASTFAPVHNSDAQEVVINNSASGYYITITNADTVGLNVDATPVGSIATGHDTINVKTNAPTGYQLYLSASSSDIYNSTDTSHSDPYLSPVAGTLDDKKSLGQNTWGFSLDDASTTELASSAIWSGVPDDSTTLIGETSSAEYATGVDTQIYYGVNANTALASGTYTTTIYYTATAEGVTEPFMQDFTNEECTAMATNSTTRLMDSRNAKIYTIVKAADGNCWMTDNLAISGTTITAADSNINSGSFYIPESSEWGTNDYSQALVHVVTEDSTSTISGDDKMPYLGQVYYNWFAATAGATPTTATSNVTTSICPKGWRLPENSTASGAKSWSNLMSAYNVTTGEELVTSDEMDPRYSLGFRLYYGDYSWYYASESNQGSYGNLWSGTSNAEANAYLVSYNSDTVNTQDNYHKGNGFAIRCVFGDSRTLQDITYMQDINTNICQNTATATSAADIKRLIDNRGQGNNGSNKTATYGVVKAADGNCWMTDNLNLYNTTTALTSTNTDIPSGTYTIPASTTWGPVSACTSSNNYCADTKRLHIADGTGYYADKTGTYYGQNYYNWCASIAGSSASACSTTSAVDQSICPKGFTLPVNGDTSRDKSWAKLMDAYKITTGPELLDNSILGFTLYYGYWYWNSNSELSQGTFGGFWSNTPSSEDKAYSLGYQPTKPIYDQGIDGKGYGYTVRCVSR